MVIPITIERLLNENVVEWARIEFKEGWNPDKILKTISAFANDIDNWGGGYIVIGAQEKDGKLVKPVKGIDPNTIDFIQKELLRYCKYLKPSYVPVSQPVQYEGVMLLLVWVPGGYDRPYQCPKNPSMRNSEKVYYIRKLSSTILASESDVKELLSLSNNIPFDDRVNINSEISDLNHTLIRKYLYDVNSSIYPRSQEMSVETLAADLRIAGGPKEYFKPLNVGLLFFHPQPEKFFPYTRIEIVNIPDPTGQGMEERIYDGPIHEQLKEALAYLKNNILVEKIFKTKGNAEAERIFNYSFDALEEFLSNAIYHRSYQIHEPITIRIEKDKIEITSVPGPDRSITDTDISQYQMRTRRYRNRRIGDFLKELHLVEGRNTGIPTALKAVKENGSPLPILLTDEERSFFSVILPIHKAFLNDKEPEGTKMVYYNEKTLLNNKKSKRRTRNEIKQAILESLQEENKSLNVLYQQLGYVGSPSRVFREVVEDLLKREIIEYVNKEQKHDSKNELKLNNN